MKILQKKSELKVSKLNLKPKVSKIKWTAISALSLLVAGAASAAETGAKPCEACEQAAAAQRQGSFLSTLNTVGASNDEVLKLGINVASIAYPSAGVQFEPLPTSAMAPLLPALDFSRFDPTFRVLYWPSELGPVPQP